MQGAFSQEQAFMCYFDFAEFKLINRYYGTKQGDIFLKEAGDYVGRQPEVLTYKRMFSDQFACVVIAKEPRSEQEIQERFYPMQTGSWRRSSPCILHAICGCTAEYARFKMIMCLRRWTMQTLHGGRRRRSRARLLWCSTMQCWLKSHGASNWKQG